MRIFQSARVHGLLSWSSMAGLLFLAGVGAGCADPGSDDDASSYDGPLEGDDDSTAAGDDDASVPAGDDDASSHGDDDATQSGDDDASHAGDDDATQSGDDDASHAGDDDATQSGDDDASHAGDDDASHTGDDDASHAGDDDASHTGDDDTNGPTPTATPPLDADGDGFPRGVDCDDQDPSTNPGAPEVCDKKDNDCNGEIDDHPTGAPVWYPDEDGDNHGVNGTSVTSCTQPDHYATSTDDCDDVDPFTYPGAPEPCDGKDNNCNGQIDEAGASTFYLDVDADSYGTTDATYVGCTAPVGYAARAGDCQPTDPAINPGATEVCNGIDDNCNAVVDESSGATWIVDADGDGAGDPQKSTQACAQPTGYVASDAPVDCDDTDATVYPNAPELCDGLDNDCDDLIDEGVIGTWYPDEDADGYGAGTSIDACVQPEGYAGRAGDCDDANPAVHPGATEVCNSIDDDCDGVVDNPTASGAPVWYADQDGDGFGDPTAGQAACQRPLGSVSDDTDCDDASAETYPGADEVCNDLDDNCNGAIDDEATDASSFYTDADHDTYGNPGAPVFACDQPLGTVVNATDCNDANGAIYPGATEVCNGFDDNCNGLIDDGAVEAATWYADVDQDGYGNPAVTVVSCTQPASSATNGQDCNDAAADTHPGATETCDGRDQNCNGVIDDNAVDARVWYADKDGDGYGDAGSSIKACSAPSGYVASSTDCQDTIASIHPGAAEACDGVDNDCSGSIDDGASCPCEVLHYGGHAYQYCDGAANWTVALSNCEFNGYSLVSLNDTTENTWVVDRAYERYAGKWWTGYNDRSSEGHFVWASGQAVTFSNWHQDEPNDSGGNEDCTQLGRFGDYTWNDEPCDTAFRYICESN